MQSGVNFILIFEIKWISNLWVVLHSLPVGPSKIDINHPSALISLMLFDFSLLTGMEEKTFLLVYKLKGIVSKPEYSSTDRFLRCALQIDIRVHI